ncbi:hypothetical protein DPEC_G00224630 [Dallia pectoralis]|uniref:Uncharacterized protein n=1 Tax=Dallia pectoralis TaxID=75939 RepID=A0ACC2G0K3_DALPE|nr:hypothetical protein DPEC_G00224630 [Dallia pectoralis]
MWGRITQTDLPLYLPSSHQIPQSGWITRPASEINSWFEGTEAKGRRLHAPAALEIPRHGPAHSQGARRRGSTGNHWPGSKSLAEVECWATVAGEDTIQKPLPLTWAR